MIVLKRDRRLRRLRKQKKATKVMVQKVGWNGQRPVVKPHPRRKVNKSTGGLNRAERQDKGLL